jgi:rhizosphere induced protein
MNATLFRGGTSVLVGSIIPFAGMVTSNNMGEEYVSPVEEFGWMVCDGRKLEAHEYPELFSVLGTLYGGKISSNDTTPDYFHIPDLRGMFLRGIGNDEASTEARTKASGGKENGVGSTQGFAVQKHVHVYTSPIEGSVSPGILAVVPVDNLSNPQDTTGAPTESSIQGKVKVSEYETRPTNIFVHYLIKYRY